VGRDPNGVESNGTATSDHDKNKYRAATWDHFDGELRHYLELGEKLIRSYTNSGCSENKSKSLSGFII